MNAGKLFAVMVVLQGLILAGQWTGAGPIRSADAQMPDPAGRQLQMVEELKTLNGKMDKLLEILDSGKLQVRVVQPDEKK